MVGSLLVTVGLIIFFVPQEYATGEFESSTTHWLDSMIFLSIGVLLILVNLLFRHKVMAISLRPTGFQYSDGENTIKYDWVEVEKLRRIGFISPPAYKLKLKSTGEHIIFVTESVKGNYVEVRIPGLNFIVDFSQMGKEIKRIKRDYGI